MSSAWLKFPAAYFGDIRLIRLRRELGHDADILPVRLWAFAAQHAQDGNLSEFQPTELAGLLGWDGPPDVMVRALESAGYLEAGHVSEWAWHYALPAARQASARKAAAGRWNRQPSPTPPPDREEESKRRGEDHALRHALRDASAPQVPFPWERIDQLPDQLRAELAAAYPTPADQQHVLDIVRGNELRFKARHPLADWPTVALAALQREVQGDARTRRGRASFA